MANIVNLIDSSYSEILKDIQDGTMVNQLSEQSEMWNYIKKDLKKNLPEGRRLRRPLQVSYGMAAVGNIKYNGSFKSTDRVEFEELIAQGKFVVGHIDVPYFVFEASKSDKGAFAKAMDVEVKAKQTALAKQLTRQALGSGGGEIATISSASGSSTGAFVVDSSNSAFGCIRWAEEGDKLVPYASISSATPVSMSNSAAYLEVISIDETAGTITVQPYTSADAAVNFASSDYSAGNVLCRYGNTFIAYSTSTEASDRSEEITGLEAIIDDSGKVHNISRSSVAAYRSSVQDASGVLLTTDMLQSAISSANKKGDGKPVIALMSHNTFNRFVEIAEDDRRLVNTKDGTLGFEKLGYMSFFGNVQFVVERYMRDDRIYLLDPRFLELYGKDFSFFEENGQIIRAAVNSTSYSPNYTSELIGVVELFCTKPSAQARVENFILG